MEEPTILDQTPPKRQYSPIIKALIILVKLLGYGLALVFATALLSMLCMPFAEDFDPEAAQSGDIRDWKSNSIMYIGILGGTFLVTWFFTTIVDRRSLANMGMSLQNVGAKLLKGAAGAIGLLSISFAILYVTGAVKIVDLQLEWVDLAGFLFLFLMAALAEELIFRGYMIPLIAKDFHFMVALLISSLAFAIVHIANAHFTWVAFVNIFLGGYLMAVIFYKNQDLYMPLGLHWFWNYYQGNILGFGVSGNEVESLLSIEMDGNEWMTGGEFGLEGSIITAILLLITSLWMTVKWYDTLKEVSMEKNHLDLIP